MRNVCHLVVLILCFVLFSGSESKYKKGVINLVDKAKNTPKPSHSIKSQATVEVNGSTASPTTQGGLIEIDLRFTTPKPTKKVLRMYPYNHRQRQCCKQGYRAAKRGYNCDINRHFGSRVTNMAHNARMKFQGRRMNNVDRKLIKRIVRYCLKASPLKRLFKKCCSTAKK